MAFGKSLIMNDNEHILNLAMFFFFVWCLTVFLRFVWSLFFFFFFFFLAMFCCWFSLSLSFWKSVVRWAKSDDEKIDNHWTRNSKHVLNIVAFDFLCWVNQVFLWAMYQKRYIKHKSEKINKNMLCPLLWLEVFCGKDPIVSLPPILRRGPGAQKLAKMKRAAKGQSLLQDDGEGDALLLGISSLQFCSATLYL